MKLKKLVLGLGLATTSVFALGSCNQSRTIEASYVDLNGDVQEVTVEKTNDPNTVLDTLKVVSKAEGKIVEETSMKGNCNMEMSGSVKNQSYKMNMDFNMLIDSTSDMAFYMYEKMNIEAAGQKQDIVVEATLIDGYAYVDSKVLGQSVKVKSPIESSTFSEMKDKMYESIEELESMKNRKMEEMFNLMDVDYTSYNSSYEVIMNNEAKVLDFINNNKMEVSKVTDSIYFSLNVYGDYILNAWNLSGASSAGNVTSVSQTDYARVTIGYDAATYLYNYFELDASNATSLFGSILKTGVDSSMNLNKLLVSCKFDVCNDVVTEPANASSYMSYSF